MKINACGRIKSFHRSRFCDLTFWIVIASFLFLAQSAQSGEMVDRIVAIVNDDIITFYELNQALQPYADNIDTMGYSQEQKRSTLFQFRQKLLNELISNKLTLQEVRRFKIVVSEEEVDNYIERLKENKYMTDEDLRKILDQQGYTMETYRSEIKSQIERRKLVDREVKSKVVITNDDVVAYYEAHPEIYGGIQKFHLWNLFVRLSPSADEAQRQAARDKLNVVMNQLQQGTAFKDLVQASNSAGQDVRGSDLGLFSLKDLSEQLQETVKGMKAGQYSDILETDIAVQVIFLQEISESQSRPLAEVESEIQDALYREIVDDKFKIWLEELRERSIIKVIN